MKKIWLFCLCLASLGLVGCFHIPDEDWLPSKNKVNTWDTQKDEEMEDALNGIMDWINMISSEWNEKNGEDSETTTEAWEENVIKTGNEAIDDEEIIDNKVENEEPENEIEENIPSDE